LPFADTYLAETRDILARLPTARIDALADALAQLTGRLFVLGLGGSAAHASHAAADFRKLCGIDAICLTDNMAAFTAAANDTGWVNVFGALFCEHRLTSRDAMLVLSVGGGTEDAVHEVSRALVWAVRQHATGKTFAILGRDGGVIGQLADPCVLIPPLYPDHVTPHTEGLTSVILHCLVTHPALQKRPPTWEGLQA